MTNRQPFGEFPPLYRALDVTEVFGKYTGRGPKIPQVGLVVSEAFLEKPEDIVRAAHEAGVLPAKTLPLPALVIANSLPFVHLDVKTAKGSQADIETCFDLLIALDPGIVGGKKPDSGVYWG